MKDKIIQIVRNIASASGDSLADVADIYEENYFKKEIDELSTLIQDEKEDSFINGFEVGYENGVYEYKRDLTDQPLTSSIWGNKI